MCGYGNRVPEGWHRISDEIIINPPPIIWEPAVPSKKPYNRRQAEALLSCWHRREWRGVTIPECEWCEPVQLCGTDRQAIGDEMYGSY